MAWDAYKAILWSGHKGAQRSLRLRNGLSVLDGSCVFPYHVPRGTIKLINAPYTLIAQKYH